MGVTAVEVLEVPRVADQIFSLFIFLLWAQRDAYVLDSNVQAVPIVGAGKMCWCNPIPNLHQFGVSNGRTI